MQPEFHSGAVTRPLSAILQLAMMGCPALRARGELAAGACAPVLGWDRGGSSSAGARAWWGACGTGARGPLRGVFGRLPLARLRESAFWGASTKYFRELMVESHFFVRQSLDSPGAWQLCSRCGRSAGQQWTSAHRRKARGGAQRSVRSDRGVRGADKRRLTLAV